MKHLKRSIVLLLALVLLVSVVPTGAAAAKTNSTYDYFTNNYTYLNDSNHVYESVTYNQLTTMLESSGTYVFLFGGTWCSNTTPVIGYINEVAKEYGIDKIYNFDTRMGIGSGNSSTEQIHIRDNSNPYVNLYAKLLDDYLTNIETIYDKNSNSASQYIEYNGKRYNKLQVPFLFVYNKDNPDGPIVAQLELMKTRNSFLTNGAEDKAKVDEYKALVRKVFEPISTNGKASYNTFSDFNYFQTAYNKAANTTIFDSSDNSGGFVFKTVTYDELTKLLNSSGNYVILFGGDWCTNTRAVAKWINQYAKKYGVTTIYNFDTRMGIGSGSSAQQIHIRDNSSPYVNLYTDLVSKYLTNIETVYDVNSDNSSRYILGKDGNRYAKLQVPFLFTYNKDHKDADGNAAPILGSIEKMYTWANTQPGSDNYKDYTSDLDTLFTDFLEYVNDGTEPGSNGDGDGNGDKEPTTTPTTTGGDDDDTQNEKPLVDSPSTGDHLIPAAAGAVLISAIAAAVLTIAKRRSKRNETV